MNSPYEHVPLPEDDEKQANDHRYQSLGRKKRSNTVSKCLCISMAIGLCLFSFLYRLLVVSQLEQTALMFIGLPTVLAIALAFAPAAESITGRIMKGMTMCFLLLGILAVEGFICIIMAAPLFYFIGLIIGLMADGIRKRNEAKRRLYKLYAFPLLTLFVCSIEGVTDGLSFNREEVVEVDKRVSASVAEVRKAIAIGPDFDLNELPGFLKLGFPCPKRIEGKGIAVGDRWTVHFAGGEGSPGDLIVEVTKSEPYKIELINVSDESHIAHWLHWRKVEWELVPEGETTRVVMRMSYRRDLDPAWYFKYIERYGVSQAGEYFMSQVFKHMESE